MMRFIQVMLMTTASKKRKKISVSYSILGNLRSTWRRAGRAQKRHKKWCNKTFGFVFIISRICRRWYSQRCFPTRVVKAKRDYAQTEKNANPENVCSGRKQWGPSTQNGDFCYTVDFFLSHVRICREPRRQTLNAVFTLSIFFVHRYAYWSFPKVNAIGNGVNAVWILRNPIAIIVLKEIWTCIILLESITLILEVYIYLPGCYFISK